VTLLRRTTPPQAFASVLLCLAAFSWPLSDFAFGAWQQDFPEPPADLTKIYYLSSGTPVPLPFEPGQFAFDVFRPAVKDKVARLTVTGSKASLVLTNTDLRFFVFVADRMDPPPHQLVRLSSGKSQRSLKISLLKGRKGYAPFAEDNIQIERRILKRLRVSAGPNRILFVNYMELRPLRPLPPGEYAIVGDSLADIAPFHVN
jgi:hypothetical protein